MGIKLEKVVPFGRCFDEYVKMFNLSEPDLNKHILGVGDGPASFNSSATKLGYKVTSVDPIYQFSSSEIQHRFNLVVDDIIAQVKATPDDWVWSYHKSPDELKTNRLKAIANFILDYEYNKQQSRYIVGELPKLPFGDNQYELALCSHFLFLYSDHYDLSFHLDSIQEMLRVSQEVRIFPLLTLGLETSPYVEPVISQLQQKGIIVKREKVKYELQKGGNEMLRIIK